MAGDSLGLPREGLSARRAGKLFSHEIRQSFILGRGMTSDDTELACFTAQAYLVADGDPSRFASSLAWRLRLWLLSVPAGIGWATLRAILRLWAGWPPRTSGVFSAGNGPAIRAPLLGLLFWDDPARLREFVRASTRVTHTDPKAERGSLLLALAASHVAARRPEDVSAGELLALLGGEVPREDGEARRWLETVSAAVSGGWDGGRFSEAMGFRGGVSGYVYQTVPAVLWAWLRDPKDFRGGMERVIGLGGDTDTTGAIFGALCGVAAGESAVPPEWLEAVWDFPRTVGWVRRLARRLHAAAAGRERPGPLPLAWPLYAVRSPLFTALVLGHGFRRLLPPW
jgi:ADP-ribosylglycohydrolase